MISFLFRAAIAKRVTVLILISWSSRALIDDQEYEIQRSWYLLTRLIVFPRKRCRYLHQTHNHRSSTLLSCAIKVLMFISTRIVESESEQRLGLLRFLQRNSLRIRASEPHKAGHCDHLSSSALRNTLSSSGLYRCISSLTVPSRPESLCPQLASILASVYVEIQL